MKKKTKKVVIATSVSVASMVLNAACAYGPPQHYEDADTYSSYESSVVDEESSIDNATADTSEAPESAEPTDDAQDKNPDIDFEKGPVVYGPPKAK